VRGGIYSRLWLLPNEGRSKYIRGRFFRAYASHRLSSPPIMRRPVEQEVGIRLRNGSKDIILALCNGRDCGCVVLFVRMQGNDVL
jgi:hypothetical protein